MNAIDKLSGPRLTRTNSHADLASASKPASRPQARAEGAGPDATRTAAARGTMAPRRQRLEAQARLDEQSAQVKHADIYREEAMPPASELGPIIEMSQLARYGYFRDESQLPKGFEPSTELMRPLADHLGLPTGEEAPRPDGLDRKLHGTVIDDKSGLVASVLVNPHTKQVVLSFAGTGAGDVAGGLSARTFGNLGMGKPQWAANLEAGLGVEPQSYEQAADMAGLLQAKLKEKGWEGYELTLTGHSKGAGEASFAAGMQKDPVRALVFSPAPLSDELLDKMPEGNPSQLADRVNCYYVEGDPVAELGHPDKLANKALKALGLPYPRSVGTAHAFPADPNLKISDPLDHAWPMPQHDMVFDQLASYAEHQQAEQATADAA